MPTGTRTLLLPNEVPQVTVPTDCGYIMLVRTLYQYFVHAGSSASFLHLTPKRPRYFDLSSQDESATPRSSSEDAAGSSPPSSNNCPSVALPIMVSSTVGESGRLSNPTTTNSDTSDQPHGGVSSSSQSKQPTVSRLESFRQGANCQDISEEAFDLLFAAWRKGTEKSYTTAWNRWSGWCTQRESIPLLQL